jgi:hypothetical protein
VYTKLGLLLLVTACDIFTVTYIFFFSLRRTHTVKEDPCDTLESSLALGKVSQAVTPATEKRLSPVFEEKPVRASAISAGYRLYRPTMYLPDI